MALANIIKEVDPPVELTQAEYNALSTAQKNDGTVYYITDGNGAFQTAATTPAEDTSGGDSNVQAELNKKVAKTDIVNNFTTTQAGYAADARALKTIADNYSLKTDLNAKFNYIWIPAGETRTIDYHSYNQAILISGRGDASAGLYFALWDNWSYENIFIMSQNFKNSVTRTCSDKIITLSNTSSAGIGICYLLFTNF